MRRRWIIAWALAVLMAVAACSEDEPAGGLEFKRLSKQDKSGVAPLKVEPLWSSEHGGVPAQATEMQLRGDSLVVHGGKGIVPHGELAVVDVETGKTRWQVSEETKLPGAGRRYPHLDLNSRIAAAGDGADWTLLVPYTTKCNDDPCPFNSDVAEYGIAAYAGRTGKPAWKQRLVPASSDDEPHRKGFRIAVAGDEQVLSLVGEGVNHGLGAQDATVLAHDIATGKKLWEGPGWWPAHIVGDTVLGHRGEKADSEPIGAVDKVDVAAFDAETGDEHWTLAERYKASYVTAVGTDVAVIEIPNNDRLRRTQSVVVDLKTGRELARLGSTFDCAADGDFVACTSFEMGLGQILMTFDASDDDVAGYTSGYFDDDMDVVHGEYVLLSTAGTRPEVVVLDRGGRFVSDGPRGTMRLLTDEYAVTVASDLLDGTYFVYRVS